MNETLNEIQKNSNSGESIYLKKRAQIDEISKYLKVNMNHLETLEYFMEEDFQSEEFIIALDEDLPGQTDYLGKVSLIKDILAISGIFFQLSKTKVIKISFQIVNSDMCQYFHTDNISRRLLCTYLGPGTEWLEESNLNREGLGKGNNDEVILDYNKIKQANQYDLLLLRGSKFAQNFKGAVHRSPPMTKTFPKRVLLKIDEMEPPSSPNQADL